MATTSKSQTDQTLDTKLNLKEIAGLFLGGISILSALLYFLGRLHIESYYYALGMNPNVMSFGIYDYMFSSFELVIMCLLIVVFLYLYWYSAIHSTTQFLGFPIEQKEKELENIFTAEQREKILNTIKHKKIRISYFYIGWIIFFYWLAIVSKPTIFDQKGIIGFYAGYVVGFGALIFANKLKIHRGEKAQGVKILAVVLIILIVLPFVTNRMADKERQRDIDIIFPIVTVICKEVPDELLNSSSNVTNRIEGELITTNNGITYILQSDNITTYAIPADDIKEIKYTKVIRYYKFPWK